MQEGQDKGYIEIPLSLEATSTAKTSYFFSYKKGIWLALALIPSVIWIPFMAATTQGRATGLILGIVTYMIAFSVFLRFVIFEEWKLRRIFADLERNKLSNYKYFWGIDRVESNGIIHYKYAGGSRLRKGVVIKLIRSTKIGRDENYEKEYRDTFRRILNEILRRGISVDTYDTLDDKRVPYNIVQMNSKLKNIEDPLQLKIATEHVKNLALIAKNNKMLEVKYLTLYFENPHQFKDILSISESIMKVAEGSKFFKIVQLLDKSEVERYIAHRLDINTFPIEDGQVVEDEFKYYGEVHRVFDGDGNEDWIDELYTESQTYDNEIDSEIFEKRKSPIDFVKGVLNIEDDFSEIDLSKNNWVDTYDESVDLEKDSGENHKSNESIDLAKEKLSKAIDKNIKEEDIFKELNEDVEINIEEIGNEEKNYASVGNYMENEEDIFKKLNERDIKEDTSKEKDIFDELNKGVKEDIEIDDDTDLNDILM